MRVPTGEVARATDAPARIYGGRIEMFDPCLLSVVDAVTSRALAPLPSLVELANELLMLRAVGILPRGQSAAAQIETFSGLSQFQFKCFRSNFDPDARSDCIHRRDSRAQAQK
jgi:16S rRNA (guanine527-N7)-methyltransferase